MTSFHIIKSLVIYKDIVQFKRNRNINIFLDIKPRI
jgi:hypothetical protein